MVELEEQEYFIYNLRRRPLYRIIQNIKRKKIDLRRLIYINQKPRLEIMELGEVYLENGDIIPEKLFYFHFRKVANSIGYRDVEGNEIISIISNEFKENIKEIYYERLYDYDSKKYIEIEKILVLTTEEIFISNANNLDYFYGNKRIISDEKLEKLVIEYKYSLE